MSIVDDLEAQWPAGTNIIGAAGDEYVVDRVIAHGPGRIWIRCLGGSQHGFDAAFDFRPDEMDRFTIVP